MKKTLLIALVVALALILMVGIFAYYQIKKPLNNTATLKFFEVKNGESTLQISHNLYDKKIIKSWWFFAAYTKYRKLSLLPGLYYLRSDMNIAEISSLLKTGLSQEKKITIIEGWNNNQMADYFEKNNIVGKNDFILSARFKQDYRKWLGNLSFNDGENLEGYLFPDTYRILSSSSSDEIVLKMLENFYNKTKDLNITKNNIILASIVEKEAKTLEDKKIIAGIFQNRLLANMKLESCPTVLYAMGVTKDKLSSEDIKFDSPYNTYLHVGLPPGPISNPGLESITAVLTPTKTNYYYFMSDSSGIIHYAKTLEEHNQNKIKYQ